MIVIDTSVAVDFLRGTKRSVSSLESELKTTDIIGMTSVSLFELLHPMYHRKLRVEQRVVKSFVHRLKHLPPDADAAGGGR